ncbi:MAG: hypothetical protein R2688_04615 [Fimbriimonadaceae bacterium]
MMELDLETAHHEEMKPSGGIANHCNGMPAIGIVAAVLGEVIITMGKINEVNRSHRYVGCGCACWYVLGIFAGYLVFAPLL